MATQRNRRVAPAARRTQQPSPMSRVRLVLEYIDINDIVPYEFNARHNQEAIKAVRHSIEQFGFNNPIILDDNNVLVAGHTRTEAAKELGYAELPFVRASHLTAEQVSAFRLVDNKVAEIATWDDDLLAQELAALESAGINFTDFGWDQAELDCLQQLVTDDCLTTAGLNTEAADPERASIPVRRAATQTRIVIGDLVFFRPSSSVRALLDALRLQHNANLEAMADDVSERLGLMEV